MAVAQEVFDEAEMLARRSRLIDAMFRSGTLIGIGTCFYMGWWLYEFFTNANISLNEMLGSVTAVDFPPVDPYLRTPEALQDYADVLGVVMEKTDVSGPTPKKSYRGQLDPRTMPKSANGVLSKASLEAINNPEGAYNKVMDFKSAQVFIDDSGRFHGMTMDYRIVMAAWEALHDTDYVAEKPKIHPVDVVANFVVHDKWYWGGVMGLASLPLISVAGDELQEARKVGEG